MTLVADRHLTLECGQLIQVGRRDTEGLQPLPGASDGLIADDHDLAGADGDALHGSGFPAQASPSSARMPCRMSARRSSGRGPSSARRAMKSAQRNGGLLWAGWTDNT